MDDFSQMLELVAQQLKGSDSALRVERAYPAKLRGNPQCEKLAVIVVPVRLAGRRGAGLPH